MFQQQRQHGGPRDTMGSSASWAPTAGSMHDAVARAYSVVEAVKDAFRPTPLLQPLTTSLSSSATSTPSATTVASSTSSTAKENVATMTGKASSKTSTSSAAVSPRKRIVAIGDLHGDLAQMKKVFYMMGIIDKDDNWAGGQHTTFVQTVSSFSLLPLLRL